MLWGYKGLFQPTEGSIGAILVQAPASEGIGSTDYRLPRQIKCEEETYGGIDEF